MLWYLSILSSLCFYDSLFSFQVVQEIARALYPYAAQREDELTFNEGDFITVISKNLKDRGWWKGKLAGKTGLFLSNMVEVFSTDEIVSIGIYAAM